MTIEELQELIEKVGKDKLPLNVFTIEDEDPYVILGKMLAVEKALKEYNDIATLNIESTKQAINNANEAMNIANRAISGIGSNPNLLINGDFRVNQRGLTELSKTGYFVDRWYFAGTGTITKKANGVRLTTTTGGSFSQFLENNFIDFAGKTLTLSAKMNNKVYIASGTIGNEEPTATTGEQNYFQLRINENDINGFLKFSWNNSKKCYQAYFYLSVAHENLEFDYMKLEIGSVATPFSPKPYAEELALCQRYYQKLRINDTQYCANVNAIYPNIDLLQTMRTKPTISVITYPSIRGNGSNLGVIDNLTSNELKDNILILSTNASSLGVVVGQIYMITNGEITADAEIY